MHKAFAYKCTEESTQNIFIISITYFAENSINFSPEIKCRISLWPLLCYDHIITGAVLPVEGA
jgi:hypothetical protein